MQASIHAQSQARVSPRFRCWSHASHALGRPAALQASDASVAPDARAIELTFRGEGKQTQEIQR
jgi:hypothetical protein